MRIIYADKDSSKIEETINNDPARVDIWLEGNGMWRNPAKNPEAIFMGWTQTTPQFYCENAEISITEDFEELGVMIDDKLKFEKYVGKVCRKVSEQFAFLKCKKKMLHFETRKKIYFAFILSHFNSSFET